jgi:hypothetical protein
MHYYHSSQYDNFSQQLPWNFVVPMFPILTDSFQINTHVVFYLLEHQF